MKDDRWFLKKIHMYISEKYFGSCDYPIKFENHFLLSCYDAVLIESFDLKGQIYVLISEKLNAGNYTKEIRI